MTVMHRRTRAGFSLIELLVVIALLAVLSALGAGAYFRIRGSTQTKADEDTVAKISSPLYSQWTAELENAREAFRGKGNFGQFAATVAQVKTIAGQDDDRALALWTYLWMKNAFPQTFAEATAATTLSVTLAGPITVTASLPARFTGLTGVTDARDQAAVLLYRIVTQKGARGQTFDEAAVGGLAKTLAGTPHRIFTDTYGNPLVFVRMCSGNQNDLNAGDWIKPGVVSNDPFDPRGRLLPANWPPATAAAPGPVRQQAATAFGLTDFASINWQPTIVSRSARAAWDPTFLATTTGYVPIPDGYIAGYKLRRPGNRGDQ